MLTIRLTAEDLGKVRFASAPAPVLEALLMLFELRQRPARPGDDDWRTLARSQFPGHATPLLHLVPSPRRVFYLDVLTPDADEAMRIVRETPASVHHDNLDRIARLTGAAPDWLRDYANCDGEVVGVLDRALRSFHTACVAPRWSSVESRFDSDVAYHARTMRRDGVAAMLNSLSPDLRLRGLTLEGASPWDREVRPDGRGLILMPSAFWTGFPLATWNPLDPDEQVLIYPARPDPTAARPGAGLGRRSDDGLSALLGAGRAAVLRTLREPHTTSGIARDARISVGAASKHTATLRGAGLVVSRRTGKAVEHRLTDLGQALLLGR